MTLDDLYNFYFTQGKNNCFSCEDSDSVIVVRTSGQMNFSKSDAMDGLYPTRVQMNFVGDNLNGSRIEMKAQKNALSSSKFRPLLAYIHEVDGEPQFYGHNMHQDENGEIVYDEQPVGVIAEAAHIEHDDEYDMDYAVALGYIWEEYNKASYILERDGKCSVSVELSIRSLSYNAEEKILVLDDFFYSGCTILGKNEDGEEVSPAMPGSNITLADFSVKDEPKFQENDKLIETLEKLISSLDNINTKEFEEGGQDQVNKFEMLLEQYGKTVEDITFEYEGLSDEELENAFATAFAVESEPEVVSEESDVEAEPESEPEVTPEESEPEVSEPEIKYSVAMGELKKDFALSLSDKQFAVYTLINDTYAEQDNDFYEVDVYEDSSEVVMHGWYSGKHYKQSYKVKNNTYSLKGDRVEVFAQYLTQDEIAKLDNMKSNYEVTTDKLAKYESEPDKIEILSSEKFSLIKDAPEFVDLQKREKYFDLSVEEVEQKAKDILLEYAMNGKIEFSVTPNVGCVKLPTVTEDEKSSPYGNLFD